jgi:hypothetical protein
VLRGVYDLSRASLFELHYSWISHPPLALHTAIISALRTTHLNSVRHNSSLVTTLLPSPHHVFQRAGFIYKRSIGRLFRSPQDPDQNGSMGMINRFQYLIAPYKAHIVSWTPTYGHVNSLRNVLYKAPESGRLNQFQHNHLH